MTVFFILLVVFSIRYSPLEEVVFLYATKVQKNILMEAWQTL